MKDEKKKAPEKKQPERDELPFGFYPPVTDWQEL